jgi:hypothetical protein
VADLQLAFDDSYHDAILALRQWLTTNGRRKGLHAKIEVSAGAKLTLWMHAFDLYLQAFENAQATFYFKDFPHGGTQPKGVRHLEFNSDYGALGSALTSHIKITKWSLDQAVQTLSKLQMKSDVLTKEKQLFAQLCVAVGEAARFHDVERMISDAVNHLDDKQRNTIELDLLKPTLNDWSGASARKSGNVAVPWLKGG